MADTDRSSSGVMEAKEVFGLLQEMAKLMKTGLDDETLAICVRLCEDGANPEALASIVRDLSRESAALKSNEVKFFYSF
ncbi:mitotic-spindle organizing protein 1-like [Stegodyphus dumicola]|uniref:mitotic-spindle organizing protein 1-like n=1 Tax=Stegodyphus dumicola TaxID=202533 RepID=UPI0015A8D5AA|nr:mitotic-spindle organizing protein 1-like [Stegodyphus dumicola]